MNENKKIYTCPMHPEIRQDKPGLCAECGMNLIPATDAGDAHHEHNEKNPETHDKHAGHSTNIFKIKFWVSLVLSVPIVAYSEVVQELLGYGAPAFYGSAYLPLVLASIIFFYGG